MKKVIFVVLALAIFTLAKCGNTPTPTPPTPKVARVKIGTPAVSGMEYQWDEECAKILDNASLAQPTATPTKTIVCTVTVTSPCGVSKSSVTVHAWRKNADGETVEVKE